jgi:hypothetical protein
MKASIHWQRLLEDIAYLVGEPMPNSPLRTPVSTKKLAEYLGVTRGTLRRWMDEGAEPRHGDGEVLLATWSRLSGKPREYAPLDRAVLSASQMRN